MLCFALNNIKKKKDIDQTYAEETLEELAFKSAAAKPPLPPSVLVIRDDASSSNVSTIINSSQSEGMLEEGRVVTVRDLLKGLYEKACQQKLWGLVRHTAGMLGKRVEDLAKAITDLLVRQKQVTVGMPPNNEFTITAPLPESDLRQLIHDVSLIII